MVRSVILCPIGGVFSIPVAVVLAAPRVLILRLLPIDVFISAQRCGVPCIVARGNMMVRVHTVGHQHYVEGMATCGIGVVEVDDIGLGFEKSVADGRTTIPIEPFNHFIIWGPVLPRQQLFNIFEGRCIAIESDNAERVTIGQ